MFRVNRWMGVVALCLMVGVAVAAIKVRDILPVGVGLIESPEGDGFAIFSVHPDADNFPTTQVQIALTDYLPNTPYFITVLPGIPRAAVDTNAAGNGRFSGTIQFDVCNAPGTTGEISIILWTDDDGSGTRAGFNTPDDPSDDIEDRGFGIAVCP